MPSFELLIVAAVNVCGGLLRGLVSDCVTQQSSCSVHLAGPWVNVCKTEFVFAEVANLFCWARPRPFCRSLLLRERPITATTSAAGGFKSSASSSLFLFTRGPRRSACCYSGSQSGVSTSVGKRCVPFVLCNMGRKPVAHATSWEPSTVAVTQAPACT